jgi:hypothetical protein
MGAVGVREQGDRPVGERSLARPGDVEARLAAVEERLDRMVELLNEINVKLGSPRMLIGLLLRQAHTSEAILRRLYLNVEDLPFPERLTAQRFRIHSQSGEDGVVLALLKEAGVSNRRFVEIGCGDNGGNSGFLAYELGWSGLMIDGNAERVGLCRLKFPGSVDVVQAWVTVETIDGLLLAQGLSGEIDFLSIDIDGNDFWVWKTLSVVSPRIVAIEYNAQFGADRAVAVPYSPDFDRHAYSRSYFGASLRALTFLGTEKGYRLVAVEPRGGNAFFLRNDVAPHVPAADPAYVFRQGLKPAYLLGFPMTAKAKNMLFGKRGSVYRYVKESGMPLVEIE